MIVQRQRPRATGEGFYQGMFEGTGNDDWDFSGRADQAINGDTGKLGLWQGGGT